MQAKVAVLGGFILRSTNQEQTDGSTKEEKEYIWGYGSGVAAATTPDYGDVVLAEYTQPFNEGDITYFRPLYQQTVDALAQFPTHIAADAAFDAMICFPTAWLSDTIEWQAIDAHCVQATLHEADVTCSVVLHVNEHGQLTQVTADRYREEYGHYQLAP